MEDRKAVIRVQLDEAAKEGLDALCERRGMTQIAVMSRLVRWFVAQDDLTQMSVLSLLGEHAMAPLARRMLERLAKADRLRKKPARPRKSNH